VVEKIEDIKDIMGYGVMSTPSMNKYRVKGMVVHSASDGVGLMIDDFDPDGRLQMQTSQIR